MRQILILGMGLILLTGCATHSISPSSPELTVGTPVEDDRTSYAPALECLSHTLTADQKKASFGVLSLPDRSGKVSYSSDSGTGAFSTQGEADLLITSLKKTGIRVIDVSEDYRKYLDWILIKGGSTVLGDREKHLVHDPDPKKEREVNFLPVEQGTLLDVVPDFMVLGSIPTLDFDSGGGIDLSYAGAGGGAGASAVFLTMTVRSVRVVDTEKLSDGSTRSLWRGEVVSAFGLRKKVLNAQQYGLVNRFLGSSANAALLSLDISLGEREAIQYSERLMADVAAYRLVSEETQVTSCDLLLPHDPLHPGSVVLHKSN